jgi:hypothetical protein
MPVAVQALLIEPQRVLLHSDRRLD